MENEILKYLSKYISLTEEMTNAIIESSFIKSFKKGTILLKEGDFSNECYFVFKGCIRSYMHKGGEEKTLEFYTEEQPVSPLSYGKKTPSEHYLECIEDTIASVSTPEMENEMFIKYPQLESVCRVMTEVLASKFQESFVGYMITTPEERYSNLIKTRPDLLQRVPQYQIASYLGIKPESLSRLRKRMMNRKAV
jgi:CRP-like cAMP-binding protein